MSKFSRFLALLLFTPLAVCAQDNLTARRPFGQHTQTFAASETFDAGITDNWKITLTGNVTSSTLIGVEAGHTYTFEICQDATGSRTFVFPSQLANPISIPSAANACITEVFQFDGTNGNIPTTTTSGGGGSGTVNSGTVNQIAKYTGATTVSSDANLDDGLTLANTLSYLGVGGISASQFGSTGSGAWTVIGSENVCSGAAAGKDVLCVGDATSHSIETSLNGGSFFPIPQWTSTSPVVHGIVAAGTFPQQTALPRGTQGQPMLEGPSAGDAGFGQLDLSLSTNVINRLVKANQTATTVYNDQVNVFTAAGTLDLSGSTVASALRAPNAAGITTALNGGIGYDTTKNNFHGGVNSADSRFPVWTGTDPIHHNCVWWSNVSGHIELGDAGTTCGGGSTPRLDQVLAATNAWTTTNGDNPLSLQFAATTAGRNSFELTESAAATSTGSPHLLYVHTLAASTHSPCFFSARGTANGVVCDPVTGTLSAIGAANINATQANGGAFPTSAAAVATNGSSQPIAATTTGSGSTVVLATSPALTTPNLGTPSAATLTNATGLPLAGLAGETDGNIVAGISGAWAKTTAIPNGVTATTQAAGDSTTSVATDSFVATAVSNGVAASNPAVAVQAATTSSSDLSGYTYNNGVSGIGATLTAGSNNVALAVDGFTFSAVGQRILVKDFPTAADRGVYSVTQIQTSILPVILTRVIDYDAPSDINNTGAVLVVNGTVNSDTSWLLTSTVNTVGTDGFTYIQFTFSPAVIPTRVGVSDVTGQSTAQSTVVLATSPATGRYQLNYYADLNTACTTGGNSVNFTFNWTDGTAARSLTTGTLSLAAGTPATSAYLSGLLPIHVGSANVSYTSTINGSCASGTSTYDIHAALVRIP